eukprot:PhF_6_TR614/c0_g1_i1/m.799/K09594/FLCN, BHD; folliculin
MTFSSLTVGATRDVLLNGIALSCMSVELVSTNKEGDVIFWDDTKNKCVGAYIFHIADSHARGQQRKFGIFTLDACKDTLYKRWPRIRSYFREVAVGMQDLAEKVMMTEAGVHMGSSPANPATMAPIVIAGFHRRGPQQENRPLPTLFGMPYLWEHFHKVFTFFLRDLLIDSVEKSVFVPALTSFGPGSEVFPITLNTHQNVIMGVNNPSAGPATFPLHTIVDFYRLLLKVFDKDVDHTIEILRQIIYSVITGLQVIVYGHDTSLCASICRVLSQLLPPAMNKTSVNSDKILPPFDACLLSFSKKFLEQHDIVQIKSSGGSHRDTGGSTTRRKILLKTLPECLVVHVECNQSIVTSVELWTNYETTVTDSELPLDVVAYRRALSDIGHDARLTSYGEQIEHICERLWSNNLSACTLNIQRNAWARKGKLFCEIVKSTPVEMPRRGSDGNGSQNSVTKWFKNTSSKVMNKLNSLGNHKAAGGGGGGNTHDHHTVNSSAMHASPYQLQVMELLRSAASKVHSEECDIPVLRYFGSWKAVLPVAAASMGGSSSPSAAPHNNLSTPIPIE